MNYPTLSTVEIHHSGAWHPAGELRALGPNKATFSYRADYVFGPVALPVSLVLLVGLWPAQTVQGALGTEIDLRPPSFVYDLVPQGQGRRFLLDILRLVDSDDMVMPLVTAGAFNPIGCIRLSTAVAFYNEQAAQDPSAQSNTGFSLDDIKSHSQDFLDHIALHAMLAAGTTGVQGVAPKFLLTTNHSDRWFADLALPDDDAKEHWLVKLPRGKSDDDRMVLRNEAAYLRLAAACGLRVNQAPMLMREMLFVRRFDRLAQNGQVLRLHQESLASLVGQRGFGTPHSQQSLLAALRAVVSDPLTETIEFIKRDVLNLAMRNTDNHARNTAVQRLPNGKVQLTPVFDFAPMFKDPEIVPRSCHWRGINGTRQTRWPDIIGELQLPNGERVAIAQALLDFANTVSRLESFARDCGVEDEILRPCLRTIEEQAMGLQQLSELVPLTKAPAVRPSKQKIP
jgi:serine/threonine-protein kinase HipA